MSTGTDRVTKKVTTEELLMAPVPVYWQRVFDRARVGLVRRRFVNGAGHGGYQALRIVLAVMLLAAAILKAYELAAQAPALSEAGILKSRWFRIATVDWEIALATLLFTGPLPRVAWCLALLTYAGFAGVSAGLVTSGATSCGCLGALQVHPLLVLGLDFVILAALYRWHPGSLPLNSYSSGSRARLGACAAVLVVILLAVPTGFAISAAMQTRSVGPDLIDDGTRVSVVPSRWLGRTFPLDRYIDGADRLRQGDWIVVLYRSDCPACAGAIEKYANLARKWKGREDLPQIALVEIPANTKPEPADDDARYLRLSLTATRTWSVPVPLEMLLTDGIVKHIW